MITSKLASLLAAILSLSSVSSAQSLFQKYAKQYQINTNTSGPIAELSCGPDFSRMTNYASYGNNFCSIKIIDLNPNADFIRINMFSVTEGKVQTLTNMHVDWGFITITNSDPAGSYEYNISNLRVIDDRSHSISLPNSISLVSQSHTKTTVGQIPDKYPIFNFFTQFIPYKDAILSFGQALDTVQPAQILAELQICKQDGQCSNPSYASVPYQR